MKILTKWKNVFINYIRNNFKEYALVTLLFIIGIFIGVIIINNCSEDQLQETSTYITDFIAKFKNAGNLDKLELILSSAKSNIFLAFVIWIAGTTVIGIPIVFMVILYRGLCLGYTISIITYTLGTMKGIGFCFISIVFQNILFIPAVLTLGVSSIKLYKSIIKDMRKENIKIEIIRHIIISLIMMVVLILSSIVENLVSVPILQNLIKYF